MEKRVLILILGFTYIYGLSNLSAQTRIHIPEPYGDNFIESELITEVSFIALQVERYGTILPDMEMRVDNDEFFILDNKNAQCVYRFDNQGNLKNTISEKKIITKSKNEPELNNPIEFNIDIYNKRVELYNFENSTISRFNYNGTEIDQILFASNPSDFIRSRTGNYWIYTGWNNTETQYRLLKTNGKGTITDRRLRLISRCSATEGFAFYARQNSILFWELLGSTVYEIHDNEILPSYSFDFGNYKLPLDYHYLDGKESFEMINQKGYYSMKKYLENDNFAYFFLNFNNDNQREMFHIIYDKKSKQTHIYTENAGLAAFDKPQAITENDELVFLVSPRKMRQLMNNDTDYMPIVFSEIMDEMMSLRNPIILKVKLGQRVDQQFENENEIPEQNYFEE